MGFEPANIINRTTGYDKTHAVHTTALAGPPGTAGGRFRGKGVAAPGAEWKHAAFEPTPPYLSRAFLVRKARSGRQTRFGASPRA